MASIFTIGHSNRGFSEFLGVLTAHGVEVVADVRSYPASRYAPQFNRKNLASALHANGIEYVFVGAELGGRPKEDGFYDAEGHVLYEKLAQSRRFQDGLERLEVSLAESRVAIMCSEENPASCHRRLLVGQALKERGVEALHLRADGSVQADDDLDGRAPTARVTQPPLLNMPLSDTRHSSAGEGARR